jgi:hypothetical protein
MEEDCRNVLLLQAKLSVIAQLISMARRLLSSPLHGPAEELFPEWSLPSRLVLKTCEDGWDEEFEVEKSRRSHIGDG